MARPTCPMRSPAATAPAERTSRPPLGSGRVAFAPSFAGIELRYGARFSGRKPPPTAGHEDDRNGCPSHLRPMSRSSAVAVIERSQPLGGVAVGRDDPAGAPGALQKAPYQWAPMRSRSNPIDAADGSGGSLRLRCRLERRLGGRRAHGRGLYATNRGSHAVARGLYAVNRGPEPLGRGLHASKRASEPLERGLYATNRGPEPLGRGLYAANRGPEPLERGLYAAKRASEPLGRGLHAANRASEPLERVLYATSRGSKPPGRISSAPPRPSCGTDFGS